MNSNASCHHGNSTLGCVGDPPAGSSVGLSMGLTLLFLFLGVGLAVLLYSQRHRLRPLTTRPATGPGGRPRTPEDTQGYRGLAAGAPPPQPADHSPIYQNFTAAAGHTALDMSRPPGEQEEDLYLQSDPLDEAIYCNEPSCSLTLLPPDDRRYEEEDLYIVPQAS